MYDRAGDLDGLVRHSDCGTQDLSIRYTARLMEAGIEPSVGSRGDLYGNAMTSESSLLTIVHGVDVRAWRHPSVTRFACSPPTARNIGILQEMKWLPFVDTYRTPCLERQQRRHRTSVASV